MPRSKLRATDLTAPLHHITSADTAVATTPVEVHAVPLVAGAYLVELIDSFDVGVTTANATWTIGVNTGFVSAALSGVFLRNNAGQTLYAVGTTNNQTFTFANTSGARSRLEVSGLVVVNAPCFLTAQVVMAADSGTLRAGSFLRVRSA